MTFCLAINHSAPAQSSAFTYQGQLQEGGLAANGVYNFRFAIFDAQTNGAAMGDTNALEDSNVVAGHFMATLDFGDAAFDGSPRWLEIAVRPGMSTGPYITLSPRQELAATPYALRAARFSGMVAHSQLPTTVARLDGSNQVFTAAVQFRNPANVFDGSFVGNGAGLSNTIARNFTATNTTPDVGHLTRFPFWINYSNNHPMTILAVGDSVSDAEAFADNVAFRLQERFGRNGWLTESFRGLEPYPTNFGGAVDSHVDTNWIARYWILPGNGAGVAWGSGITPNGVLSSRCEIFWIQQPHGGAFEVQIMANGDAWTSVKTLDGGGPSRVGAYTNFPINYNFNKVRVLNNVVCTNFIIGHSVYSSGWQGVRYASISRFGIQMNAFTNVSPAIRDVILTNMRPTLVISYNREFPTPSQVSCMPEYNRWLSLAKASADVIYVGGYPWGFEDEGMGNLTENYFWFTNALNNGFAYWDLATATRNYAHLVNNRFVFHATNPHPTEAGQFWISQLFEQRFGLAQYYPSSSAKPFDKLVVTSQGTNAPLAVTHGDMFGTSAVYIGGFGTAGTISFGEDAWNLAKAAVIGHQSLTQINDPGTNGPSFSRNFATALGHFEPAGKLAANFGFIGDGSALTNLVQFTANATSTVQFNSSGQSETVYRTNESALANITLNLPSASTPGQIVRYATAGAIGSVNVTGSVAIGSSVTNLSPNEVVAWQAINSAGQWLRVK